MSFTTVTQPMVKLLSGRMVPAARSSSATSKTKRFLVVLQFYEGDRDAAEEVASLIADLERTRNHDADVLLMRRADCRELSLGVKSKLETKFNKVLTHTCRRQDAKGYPFASNSMFFDLVTMLSQFPEYRNEYHSFINLETDCVPMRSGWIGELTKAWMDTGVAAIGHIHDNPVPHLNGVAVYAIDLWRRVGGNVLSGGNPQIAFDIWHSKRILPLAKDTPLVFFHYRRPTITAEELWATKKDGVTPALYHGVKDGSARAAVRERYVAMNGGETRRKNVYTYFHNILNIANTESGKILEQWRKGWSSRGWNPVVMTKRDAIRHPSFTAMEAALVRLPWASPNREHMEHIFYRWLALDGFGGGLLTGYNVLPLDEFDPKITESWSREILLRATDDGHLLAMYLSNSQSSEWIEGILKYDAQPDDHRGGVPHVTDRTIANRMAMFSQVYSGIPLLKYFEPPATGTERQSAAMEQFLAGS